MRSRSRSWESIRRTARSGSPANPSFPRRPRRSSPRRLPRRHRLLAAIEGTGVTGEASAAAIAAIATEVLEAAVAAADLAGADRVNVLKKASLPGLAFLEWRAGRLAAPAPAGNWRSPSSLERRGLSPPSPPPASGEFPPSSSGAGASRRPTPLARKPRSPSILESGLCFESNQ